MAQSPFMLTATLTSLLTALALPTVGLSALFMISLLSATLLPMGSEPAVFAIIKLNPALFWSAIGVATVGNTIGGVITYWMGVGAKKAFAAERQTRWFGWLQQFGPKTLILAWVPIIGDPLCAVAGWLKMPFWPSVFWMALGKFLRYVSITAMLLVVPDGFWHRLMAWL